MDCGTPGRAISSNETKPHERITALERVFDIELTSFGVLNEAFLGEWLSASGDPDLVLGFVLLKAAFLPLDLGFV